jgi:tetratricopeptide (TPR) repeat protein
MFKSIFGKKKVKGHIGYYGLEKWWFSEFSQEERERIEEKFQPIGSSNSSLTSGDIESSTESLLSFLSNLAGWFSKKEDLSIAYRILEKGDSFSKSTKSVLDRHFFFGQKVKAYYKSRENKQYFDEAVKAAEQQIALANKAAREFKAQMPQSALPSHIGYQQLAIILEKQKEFDEAIELCRKAKKQRWSGDWDKRIERCKKNKN